MSDNDALEAITVNGVRKKVSLVILLVFLLGGTAGGVLWYRQLQRTLSTDNAKVTGDIVDISPKVNGRLEKILVEEGSRVKKGQILAILDNAQFKTDMEQAEASLRLAQANYARLPEDINSAQAAVDKARDGLLAAQAQVESATIAVADARRTFEQNENLFEAGAVSRDTLEASRTRYQTAQAALESCQANAQAAQAALQDAESKYKALQKTGKATSQAQIEQARAAYEKARLAYENTAIRAPVGGTVLRIVVQAGENVVPGQTILSISDLGSTWVVANIDENKIGRVRTGQKVDIKIDAYPGKILPGKVAEIGGTVQSTFALIPTENTSGNFTKVAQRIPVKITVDKRGLLLKPGMSAVIKIYTK